MKVCNNLIFLICLVALVLLSMNNNCCIAAKQEEDPITTSLRNNINNRFNSNKVVVEDNHDILPHVSENNNDTMLSLLKNDDDIIKNMNHEINSTSSLYSLLFFSTASSSLSSIDNIENNHRLMQQTTSFDNRYCVYNATALRAAVNKALSVGPNYTRIDLCKPVISLTRPLNVTNKRIEFGCNRPPSTSTSTSTSSALSTTRCILNAGNRSTFMFGNNANIITNRIHFYNGYSSAASKAGIRLQDSTIHIQNSFFLKNNHKGGSVLYMNASSFYKKSLSNIILTNVTFIKNLGKNMIHFVNSNIIINAVVLKNNIAYPGDFMFQIPPVCAAISTRNSDILMIASSITYNVGDLCYGIDLRNTLSIWNNVTLEHNKAFDIISTVSSNISMYYSSISSNNAEEAIMNLENSHVNMNSIKINSNQATGYDFGGIIRTVEVYISILNSTIHNNTSYNGPNLNMVSTALRFYKSQFTYNYAETSSLSSSRNIRLYNTDIKLIESIFFGNINRVTNLNDNNGAIISYGSIFQVLDQSFEVQPLPPGVNPRSFLFCVDNTTMICYNSNNTLWTAIDNSYGGYGDLFFTNCSTSTSC